MGTFPVLMGIITSFPDEKEIIRYATLLDSLPEKRIISLEKRLNKQSSDRARRAVFHAYILANFCKKKEEREPNPESPLSPLLGLRDRGESC